VTRPPTAREVLAAVNTVVDPCARAAGAPVGIVDMGLVSARCTARDGWLDVHLGIRVTEPTCIMFHTFARDAHAALVDLPGIGEITLELEDYRSWTEADMTAEARERLATARRARGLLPLAVVDGG
jgi:metal-sulfur cluster biosynthetic enzyme